MPEPFRIAVPDADIADLKSRLRASRRPAGVVHDGGVTLAEVDRLVRYWLDDFDWRAHEAALNALPQYTEMIAGGRLHFVHVRSERHAALPLLLLHGWPGSFVEMRHVVSALAERFDVVVPSLPGYAFSTLPQAGFSHRRIAAVMAELMSRLGYERFGVQGGDWGASIGTWMALDSPERVAALHLNYIPGSFAPFVAGDLDDAEREFLRQRDQWVAESGAYGHIQRTRPLTVAYGLSDSPIGLAAYIFEKFVEWSDPETLPTLDDILTNIAIYWFTNSIASSVRLYYESVKMPLKLEREKAVSVPTGILRCRLEAPFPPRSWIERGYNVTRWMDSDRGGHFAALEVPQTFVAAVEEFFA